MSYGEVMSPSNTSDNLLSFPACHNYTSTPTSESLTLPSFVSSDTSDSAERQPYQQGELNQYQQSSLDSNECPLTLWSSSTRSQEGSNALNDGDQTTRSENVQPSFVISSCISPAGSAASSCQSPNVAVSLPTPSPIRHLSVSPSATSLSGSRQSVYLPTGVVRSASAYAYPTLQLPIPPRSPGLSPVTRISFSTDPGSSLASSVSTHFGGSQTVDDVGSVFESIDIRMDLAAQNPGY
ncbi:hypothetical protein FHG87_004715, partial [Trinorchestia longiramus]